MPAQFSRIRPDKNMAGGYNPDKGILSRTQFERLRGQLLVERSTFLPHWEQLARFIKPRRSRFFTTDRDRGNRRNHSIIDSTGTLAHRTLQSGMMAGFTSPSRPWFRLVTYDPDLDKRESVKEWLYLVTDIMANMFMRSNLYTTLPTFYGDMGLMGTGAFLIEEDFDSVMRCFGPFPVGSYYLIANDKWLINGFMRDFQLTVRQIVEQFAMDRNDNTIHWDRVSGLVKTLFMGGTTEAWLELSHVIIPNPDWDPQSSLSEKKKYLSVYWERGSQTGQYSSELIDDNRILSQKGYDKFRVICGRWEVTGEDIYGTDCPGMTALGDVMGNQTMERRGMQALEKSINPPMVAPSALKNQKATVLPGDITYQDLREGQKGFEPAYTINPNFQQLELKQNENRTRVKECFYYDLFRAISDLEKSNVTAEEIRALKEEKLQDLGPMADRLNVEVLDPIVEHGFDLLMKQGHIPPPPQELRGMAIKPEYMSIMAAATKAQSVAGIERFVEDLTKIRELEPQDPGVLDKANFDEAIEHLGNDLSIPPGIIRDDDDVAKMRDKRQKAQAAAQKAQQLQAAAETANKLAGAKTAEPNALTDLMAQGDAGKMLPAA
jgi:hypothetical protein